MTRALIVSLGAAMLSAVWVISIYWAGGLDFRRGEGLLWLFILTPVVSVWIGCGVYIFGDWRKS